MSIESRNPQFREATRQLTWFTDALTALELSEANDAQSEPSVELDSFKVKTTTIRRLLEQMSQSDSATQRFLRLRLDEEFAELRNTFQILQTQATAKHKGGSPWSGSSLEF